MLTGTAQVARRGFFRWLMAAWLVAVTGVIAGAAETERDDTVNDAVLAEAYGYEDGGGYVWKNSTGSPRELVWQGEVVLRKQPEGTYCSGFTFAVMFEVARQRGLFDGKTVRELKMLQRRWYGAVDDKMTREVQSGIALQKLGIGKRILPADAKAGDFLQFWRTRSGHSVVFLSWLEEDGERVGIRYRSTQGATDGIGDHEERFKAHGGHVDPQRCYFARLDEAQK
ncbi:hypothetical protein [Mucisphaera calidilacus]|uniref:Uncharacterized protein n=1 Tax=Mucisphaera calidilacus TaxID=2527982 RepID=A0A518BY12_9BACT|nr:hypothetical protein [Mucisphaera calidilacus]QDU71865.1 hypothetical protein Pan265_17210 [Mucisphaera calidilacus]